MKTSFTPAAVHHQLNYTTEKGKNFPRLQILIAKGIMKTTTVEHVAGSGLNLRYLELINQRGGKDALKNVFIAENGEGQSRSTYCTKALEEVTP